MFSGPEIESHITDFVKGMALVIVTMIFFIIIFFYGLGFRIGKNSNSKEMNRWYVFVMMKDVL
jgi:predicted permease